MGVLPRILAAGTLADNDSVVMAVDGDLSLLEDPAIDKLLPWIRKLWRSKTLTSCRLQRACLRYA